MQSRKLKILWLHPKAYWDRKMSAVRRDSLLAISRHGEVEMIISGPGWPNYRVDESVQRNLERLLPECDLVGWYKPLGEVEANVRLKEALPLIDPQGVKVPRCLRFNEAWWPDRRAMEEARRSGTRLVICHHAEDLPQFSPMSDWQVAAYHLPHCAEKSLFLPASRPQAERDIDVLLTGSLMPELYPLRVRFQRLIDEGKIPGIVRRHPPPFLGSLDDTLAQIRDYANDLGRAKIVVTDGTIHKYPLSKYSEAAMAGALVLGTMPNLPPTGFADLVVPIEFSASDEDLVDAVRYWLDHHEERARRAQLAQQRALEMFTQEHYADGFVRIVRSYLDSSKHEGAIE